jgi:hypothetical protein
MNTKLTSLILAGALCAAWLWLGSGSGNGAAAYAQTSRPTIAPVPTAQPTPLSLPPVMPETRAEAGAWIELQAPPVYSGARAVVQWQDPSGKWHDVDGWRSTLDHNTGPFRWSLTRAGTTQTSSAPFMLPRSGETRTVAIE